MWPNPQETPDLVIFTKDSFNRKLNFCAVANICSFGGKKRLSDLTIWLNDLKGIG